MWYKDKRQETPPCASACANEHQSFSRNVMEWLVSGQRNEESNVRQTQGTVTPVGHKLVLMSEDSELFSSCMRRKTPLPLTSVYGHVWTCRLESILRRYRLLRMSCFWRWTACVTFSKAKTDCLQTCAWFRW
jgi:hypothetical protein